jgi:hypothetical protein
MWDEILFSVSIFTLYHTPRRDADLSRLDLSHCNNLYLARGRDEAVPRLGSRIVTIHILARGRDEAVPRLYDIVKKQKPPRVAGVLGGDDGV